MKKITKIVALVLAVVLMATAFAACGSTSNKVKCINIPLTDVPAAESSRRRMQSSA